MGGGQQQPQQGMMPGPLPGGGVQLPSGPVAGGGQGIMPAPQQQQPQGSQQQVRLMKEREEHG